MSLLNISDNNPTYLYLVSSGCDDNAYKIGISSTPDTRLVSIQKHWSIPEASILDQKLMDTRTLALNTEKKLHQQYLPQLCEDYSGHEWFTFDDETLSLVRNNYT